MAAELVEYSLRRYGRRLAMGATLVVALVIAWGSLMPADELPSNLPWDKLNHLSAYAALAFVAGLAGRRPWRAAILAVIFGVAIEFAQMAVPGRQGGDPADMLANALGAVLGVVLLATVSRLLARRE